jgi:hypothetical protein
MGHLAYVKPFQAPKLIVMDVHPLKIPKEYFTYIDPTPYPHVGGFYYFMPFYA